MEERQGQNGICNGLGAGVQQMQSQLWSREARGKVKEDEAERINTVGGFETKDTGRITGQHKLLSSSFNPKYDSLNYSSPWIKS